MTCQSPWRRVAPLVLLAVTVAFVMTACGNSGSPTATPPDATGGGAPAGGVAVDVVYVSHIPGAEAVFDEIAQLFVDTPKVTVTGHDVTTPDGQAFATARRVNARFVVLVNGKSEQTIDGQVVSLADFPRGRGTSNVPEWRVDPRRAPRPHRRAGPQRVVTSGFQGF